MQKQKEGNGERWTLEKIKLGFENFFKKHGRYPTATEIDEDKNLPSSRQIQRRFVGGLPALRKQLKLDGPEDFTKGSFSSKRALMISKRAHRLEKEVYNDLAKMFEAKNIHREFFFTDDRRTRTDFFIYSDKGDFSVDVFYPKDINNLTGCINSKMRSYRGLDLKYPVIFLMMNPEIKEEEIERFVNNKKNKLQTYQRVMTLGRLKEYCKENHHLS
ncbi:MAG: hypothetical protein HQ402_01840 [Parcubacteria group bacterium]|nr:hypothetical protein [Parcubacteria group bacterium]